MAIVAGAEQIFLASEIAEAELTRVITRSDSILRLTLTTGKGEKQTIDLRMSDDDANRIARLVLGGGKGNARLQTFRVGNQNRGI